MKLGVLLALSGFWLLMRSVNKDSSGRTLVDHLVGNPSSVSPFLNTPIGGPGSPSSSNPSRPGATFNLPTSSKAGGFLPASAKYVPGRKDQGRDGQTNPGGPIIAPGNGYIVRIGSDPSGFGPRYPIVKFTSGPYAGKTMYIGHVLAAFSKGAFDAGQILGYTGKSGGVGNATVPGWFEIGYAAGGSPGPMGQPAPF